MSRKGRGKRGEWEGCGRGKDKRGEREEGDGERGRGESRKRENYGVPFLSNFTIDQSWY